MHRRGDRGRASATIAWTSARSDVDDGVGLPVRNVLTDFGDVGVDVAFLARQERRDGPMKFAVAQPVARPRRLRYETARNLVLALCPRLEPLQAFANAVVDA